MTPDQVWTYEPGFTSQLMEERSAQVRRYSDSHDDSHAPADWALLILRYAGRFGDQIETQQNYYALEPFHDTAEEELTAIKDAAVQLAAVCAAFSDRLDREYQRRLVEARTNK